MRAHARDGFDTTTTTTTYPDQQQNGTWLSECELMVKNIQPSIDNRDPFTLRIMTVQNVIKSAAAVYGDMLKEMKKQPSQFPITMFFTPRIQTGILTHQQEQMLKELKKQPSQFPITMFFTPRIQTGILTHQQEQMHRCL